MFVCSVQMISRLDNESKVVSFQAAIMILVDTNMVTLYWALLIICAEHFDEYLKFGITHRHKTWRSVFFIYLL